MPFTSPDFHQKSFRIKHDEDKFFAKFLSKESSKPNSSFRVYYGDVTSAVPFIWETCPGTPKRVDFHENCSIPPLTPPPSYYTNFNLNNSSKKNSKSKMFLHTLLRRMNPRKPDIHLASSPSSLASVSCSSSSYSSFRDPMMSTPTCSHRRRRRFPSWGGERVLDNQVFGFGKKNDQKKIAFNLGYSSVHVMKKAFLTIVGHRST